WTSNDGGGIYMFGVTAIIRNSTITGNSAGRGGGIAIKSSDTVTIQNCTITGNTATSTGANASGGITRTTTTGSLTIANTVLAQNTGGVNADSADINLAGNALTANSGLLGVKPPTL